MYPKYKDYNMKELFCESLSFIVLSEKRTTKNKSACTYYLGHTVCDRQTDRQTEIQIYFETHSKTAIDEIALFIFMFLVDTLFNKVETSWQEFINLLHIKTSTFVPVV